tara:strand:+ start:434 stop:937 length:504 start_codon:yes stop_codon:yes gene_type:complete
MNKSIFSINSFSKYSELFQIVGVIGLIASLIFVGMELRQSQQIALAEQQVERTKAFVDVYNTATNNGLAFMNFDNDYNKEEIFQVNFWHIFWNLSETDYLKYRLGLMDENIWQSRFAIMKRFKSRNNMTKRECLMREDVWNRKRNTLDTEFINLIEMTPSVDCNELK